MFMVHDAAAHAIQQAFATGGLLAATVEFRRHFPAIVEHDHALTCVRMIVGWAEVHATADEPPQT